MYYEINVALNGRHFFATHQRSLHTESEMKKCLEIFVEKFPESEGYNITIEHCRCVGKLYTVNEILGSD